MDVVPCDFLWLFKSSSYSVFSSYHFGWYVCIIIML